MLIDGRKKLFVLEGGNFILVKWLDEGLLNQNWGLFNQIILFFEQLLIFISWKWESFKWFDKKLGNNKILLFFEEGRVLLDVVADFLVVFREGVNFHIDDMIDLFFTFLQKLFEDHDDLIQILFFLQVGSFTIILQNSLETFQNLLVVIQAHLIII